MIRYRIVLLPELQNSCSRLPPSVKQKVRASLRLLEIDPLAGKPLERELLGYQSYAIPPHRIIYRVESAGRIVRVFFVGHRRDVYEVFVQKINSGEVRERRALYIRKEAVGR